jgi:hypothetical protein
MHALKSGFCGKVLGAAPAPAPAEPDVAAPEDSALDAADDALVAAADVVLVVDSLLGALPQAARARPATANPATTLRL